MKPRTRPHFLERLFTQQERLALAFVLGALALGAGLRWLEPAQAPRSRWVPASPEVRVNRAGVAELAALPGIGPVLAQRLIEERQRHGSFLTLEDLGRVRGVTSKTRRKLEGLVRFD